MKNWVKYFIINPLLALLVILLLLATTVFILLTTQTGTSLALQTVQKVVPNLAIEGVKGTIGEDFTAERIAWSDAAQGLKVEIEQADLRARITKYGIPPAVDVPTLQAERVVVTLPPSDDSAKDPVTMPEIRLPASLNLRDTKIKELLIQQGDQQYLLRDVELKANNNNGILYVDKLSTSLDDQAGGSIDLNVSGQLGLLKPHPTKLKASAQSTRSLWGYGQATLEVNGNLPDYALDLAGQWTYRTYPTYDLAAKGQGNFEQVQLDSLNLEGAAGDISGQGRLAWAPNLRWDFQANGSEVDPAPFVADLPGSLALELTTQGELTSEGPVLSVDLKRLQGQLREYPIDVTAQAGLDKGAIKLNNLLAKVGDNQLQAEGEGADALLINWALDAPTLSQLHPTLKGELVGKGNLSGAIDGANLALSIEELKGSVQEYALAADGKISLNDGIVTAEQLKLNVGGNQLSLNGVADEQQGIDWVLDAPALATLSPQLTGELKGQGNAQGLLDGSRLAIRIDELQGTVLDRQVNAQGALLLRDQLISADDVKVTIDSNVVTLNGVADESQGIDWTIDAKDLSELAPTLSGELQGKGNAQGLLDGSRLALRIDDLSGNVLDRPINAQGQLKLQDKLISAQDVKINIGDNQIELNGVADEAQGIDWTIDASNLSQLSEQLKGNLSGRGNAQGLLDGSRLALRVDNLSGNVLDREINANGSLLLKDQLITANGFKLNLGKNQVELNGVADEAQGIDWTLKAEDLSQILPSLSGNVSGSGNAQGLLDGSRLALRIDDLEGNVLKRPIKAEGQILVRDQVVSAEDLSVAIGDNNLFLNGIADEAQGLDWRIDAKDLSQLEPSLKGNLQAKGNAQGLLDGSRLAVRIDELEGKVLDRDLSGTGSIKLENQLLSAQNLRLAVGDNQITLNGQADESTGLDWTLDAKKLSQLSPAITGELSGRGNAQGLLDGSRFAVQIERLDGKINEFPLNATGAVRVRNQVISADDLKLAVGRNQIRLNGVADEAQGINWSLDAPDLSQLAPALKGQLDGRGNLKGLLDGSRLSVQIDRLKGEVQSFPLQATGQVRLQNQQISANDLVLSLGKNQLRLDGVVDEKQGLKWRLDAKQLSQINPALKGQANGDGRVRLKQDGSDVQLSINKLSGQIQDLPLNASGNVRWRDNKTLIADGLRLSVGQNRLQLDGVANDKAGLAWSLDAPRLQQLSPTITGALKGKGSIQNLLKPDQLTVKIAQLQGRVQEFPLNASGEIRLQDKVINANNVVVEVGQNRLLVNGSASDRVGIDWQLDARNLSQIAPAIKGSVKGNGRLSGKIDGSDLVLDVARLQGQIDGRPLQATGKVQLQGKLINLQAVRVMAGNNVLEANGRASEPFDIQWRINAPNLAQAWPGLAGSLKGEGSVRGALAQPQIQGNLQGSQLAYQGNRVAKLSVQARQAGNQYDVRAVLEGVRQGENQIKQAEFNLQGQIARHTASLSVAHQAGRLDMRASGGWANQQWRGVVESLSLRDTAAGNWQLTNAVAVTAGAQALSVANACLANAQNARLCSKADWTPNRGLSANGLLQQVPLSLARTFLPPTVQLPGVVNGDFQFEQRGGRPVGRINIQLPDNVVVLRTGNQRTETLQYTQAQASLNLNDRTAQLQAQIDIRGRGQLRADGRIDFAPQGNQHRIDMRANVSVPNISWMQAFSPQIDELQGQINGDVRVTGLLSQPQVTGALRLQNASVYLLETGARLEDITLTAQANNADQVNINGSLRAGPGTLQANGVLRLAQLPNWSADLRLQGNRLLLMNTYEVQGYVSPDLAIKANPKAVVVTGALRIPEALISLSALPTGASVRSDDIVIVGRQVPQAKRKLIPAQDGPAIDIQPNVAVELGDKVKVNAFGLDARLAGQIRVLRNRQDIVAEGVLSVVDGVYKAYGQDLRIERGRLIFNGPLDNPGLDVRAVRQVEDDITVGISLNGSVKQPESVLFSNPQQTQTDTLSYLLTGRALSGVSGNETALLTQAVTSLGLAGGETLIQNLGGSLGLDEVGISSGGGDYKNSELALGKRLGSKLYIKYIVGLFDSLQRIAVTYDVNKRLKIEAKSGYSQSIGLIYKIETDKGLFGQ